MASIFLATPAASQPVTDDPQSPVEEQARVLESVPTVYGPPDNVAYREVAPAPITIPKPLDRAATLAASTHPLVGSAEAEAVALEAEHRGAKWGRYPSLSVEALAATSGSTVADRDGLALNAALEQPLWAGGRISSEIARTRANMRAGENRVGEAQRQITLRVVEAYYNFVQADARAAVLEDSLRQHKVLLASISRRVDHGVSPLTDLTLGRSRTAQVELNLATNEETRQTAWLQLFELTGGVAIEPVMPPPQVAQIRPPEDIAIIEAISCDPGLASLTNQIMSAEAQRDVAKAQLLPQLLLQLSQNEITGARAAFVLRMQLGNGGSQFANIEAADARVVRALAELGEGQRQLREELRRDYILIRAASARIEAGTMAVGSADDIVESYKRLFIAGRRSWLDVMNAVREAGDARLSESDARVLVARSSARIQARTCRWLPRGRELTP